MSCLHNTQNSREKLKKKIFSSWGTSEEEQDSGGIRERYNHVFVSHKAHNEYKAHQGTQGSEGAQGTQG